MAPALLLGSYYTEYGEHKPVYMSYAELRQSVAALPPQPMSEMGRLVIYQDHLFINELNKGLHVIDNTDPAAPQAVGFINIPGNTDVSIRDGYLYADSFVDLVVIDIRDSDNIVEINRQIDIYPWDEHQVVGNGYWFYADPELGVVIGLKQERSE